MEITLGRNKSPMIYGQDAAPKTFAFRFHFVGLIRAVFMYTMTKSQCFDTSSSPDKCDGEERRGGGGGDFKRPRKKIEKKEKNQMMQGRVEKLEGGCRRDLEFGKYLILPKLI